MYNEFWKSFRDGLQGKNKGLPIGFPKLEKHLNGVHRGRYYTVFSEGGTGKSSFVWSTFIIGPLDHMIKFNRSIKNNPDLTEEEKEERKMSVKIKLYSLEVVRREVIAKMVCLKIYRDYGLIVSADYILNRIEDYKVSKFIMYLIQSYKTYFEWLEKEGYLEIIDTPKTPSAIRRDIDVYAHQNGEFTRDAKGDLHYTANNPNEYVVIITDTVGNLTIENVNGKTSTKSTIDLHSANCRYFFRDCLNYIPINISHSNRSMSDPNRARMGEVFPKMSDIKETGMLEQDSSVVMTIFNPMNHLMTNKKLEKFMGYDITKLQERFRCLGILKNRHGGVNNRVGLLFVGENGHFEELPRSVEMTALSYQKILNMQPAMYKKDKTIAEIIEKRNPHLYSFIQSDMAKKNKEK
jgi:VCBS repeat-containing protein